MIGKKIPNPRKSGTLGARVRRLADYINDPENTPPHARAIAHAAKAARVEGLADYAQRPTGDDLREKCIHDGARGFFTTTRNAQKAEMLALAQNSTHSKDPINHYVLSWREGEQPTPAQIEEAVDVFLDTMGLVGHQTLYGLHADTDNVHLHLMVNRVHPLTRKVIEINKGFDLEALHRAVARIEHVQGWRRETRGRYRVQADGTVQRVNRSTPAGPEEPVPTHGQSHRGNRHASGAQSATRMAAETGAPVIRAARSWRELHERLAALGLRYQRKGSGAVLWVGETAVKASRTGRDCSLLAVERRLGVFQPAPEGLRVAARPPEPDMSETERWAEYHAAREVHQRHKRAATQARRDAQAAEREALRAAQRRQRDALWRSVPPGGWRGRGTELNPQRSLLAARQAAERAALLERQRRARMHAQAQWGHFPTDEDWLAAQTTGPAHRRARLIALRLEEEETLVLHARDIRGFVAIVYGRRVDYRRADAPDGPAGFVDRGREIIVQAEHDETAVRAALQLAAHKWGRFQVEGDAAYQALCVRLAAECGLPLGNPELQAAMRQARATRTSGSLPSMTRIGGYPAP
ncbi:MAG: relaxase/mobilization nuclease domain-containing protein [Gammaproteobacteria bacterium]|nr:relaxase/mobilization nuclease domain-containing protein [Gammaproteobacteria bacterium]